MWRNEETGHVIEAPFDLERADRLLCAISGERAKFDALTDHPQGRMLVAMQIIENAMTLANIVVGEAVLDCFYHPEGEGENFDLITLAQRISPLITLFRKQQAKNDPVAVMNLGTELIAVANGDGPKILEKRKRRRGVDNDLYRQAIWRLRALCWLAFLDGQGVKRRDSDYWVGSGFDIDSDTIRDTWLDIVRTYIPEEIIQGRLSAARSASVSPYLPELRDKWSELIAQDGQRWW